MINKFRITCTIFLLLILFNTIGCATTKEATPTTNLPTKANYSKAALLMLVMDILQKDHVDGHNATIDQLFDAAIHGMVRSMDPYSDYEEKKDLSKFNTRLTGETYGIGIEFVKAPKKYPIILTVIKNSPAGRSKLQAGDIIKEINNKDTLHLNIASLSKLIKGKINTKVTFTIIRPKLKEPLKITVTRNKFLRPSIPENSIKVLTNQIGYLKVNNFNTQTDREFYLALMELKKRKIKSLIIDLRNNGGGIVETASKMAAILLPPNKEIYTSFGRNKRKIKTVTSNIVTFHETKLPIVILVNNSTASSSEIFTGALFDHKRATVVGSRTFGKGTLLKVIKLPGNSGALRYAFGQYHTPNGSVIEKRGITPHHKVLLSFENTAKLAEQSSIYPGVVKPNNKNSIQDIQLAKAIELLSPKKVVKKTITKDAKPEAKNTVKAPKNQVKVNNNSVKVNLKTKSNKAKTSLQTTVKKASTTTTVATKQENKNNLDTKKNTVSKVKTLDKKIVQIKPKTK